jgi:glutamate formiminotransferase
MLECVINISEGRRPEVVARLAAAAGPGVLDVHADADHNRSVFTLAGPEVEESARGLARAAVDSLDLARHSGVHPRIGVVDVVPFVPLGSPDERPPDELSLDEAVAARDRFALWAADELELPCFLYGPERSLPELRRRAWRSLLPDVGPRHPHATAGGCAVGARPMLVAYNVWLDSHDLELAQRLAEAVRGPAVRALGFAAGDCVQVSMNLVDPQMAGPAQLFDAVRDLAGSEGVGVERAELVGLLPAWVLEAIPSARWGELDLGPERTIDAHLS